MSTNAPEGYFDVWVQFKRDDEEARAGANTRTTKMGYAIDRYYLNAGGLVTTVEFNTFADAYDWYEEEGFKDYSPGYFLSFARKIPRC